MAIYLSVAYNIRIGKSEAFKNWLGTPEASGIFKKINETCGMKYLATYFTIVPSSSAEGDYDAYDWWELPDFASFDKAREINAFGPLVEKTWDLTEPRPNKFVLMRTASDVRIIYEPKT